MIATEAQALPVMPAEVPASTGPQTQASQFDLKLCHLRNA